MSTEKQIAANRANSQKSTGPTSPEGKAKSSLNHLSHGFAASARIIPGEDREEFKALLLDLMSEFEPAAPTEQILVEKMAVNQWLSRRAFRLQTTVFVEPAVPGDRNFALKDLGLLIRYHNSAERAFHKAHNELVKTQKERKKSEIGFEPQNAGETADPPPAQPETVPKIVPITCVKADFPAQPANSVAPDAHLDTEISPDAPEFRKDAA